jgi:hypothetical protein
MRPCSRKRAFRDKLGAILWLMQRSLGPELYRRCARCRRWHTTPAHELEEER